MKNGIKHAFIASSKVIRFKVGVEAADVLAVLIAKKRYWNQEEKLFEYKGNMGFYISGANLEEETCYKSHTIRKGLAKLKEEGLIVSKKQGLGKPNFYSLNQDVIEQYIKNHLNEYEEWRLTIRDKNKPVTPINSKTVENDTSRNAKMTLQEVRNSTTTNNKNTNNKNTKKKRLTT